ncbi:MAG: rod shape-determining protein MreD [Acidimicrobiales bacterium]|nr:rod shape-determining protein MreD [Acidimicrobiales bacterium]
MSPLRVAAVVVGALTLQVTLLSRFSYEGARPDVMLLIAVLAGYLAGPDRGAVVGFASGLAFDVVLTTPFGLTALTSTLVGYGVGALTGGMVRSSRLAPSGIAAAGSAVGILLYAVLGAVLGQPTLEGPSLTAIVVLVSVVNAVLAPLAVRALAWTIVDDHDRRTPFVLR